VFDFQESEAVSLVCPDPHLIPVQLASNMLFIKQEFRRVKIDCPVSEIPLLVYFEYMIERLHITKQNGEFADRKDIFGINATHKPDVHGSVKSYRIKIAKYL
jgi:hypothetical protein